jgi:hypothetical protein
MAETQNYQNHVRYFPLVHFILFPILLFNLIWQSVELYLAPSWDRGEMILMAIVFIGMNVAARAQALSAQDRTIRLEESLRYQRVLVADLAFQANQLPFNNIVALRFASDEELPDLVQKAINGEFKGSKEIKIAIKNWRGDYLRV